MSDFLYIVVKIIRTYLKMYCNFIIVNCIEKMLAKETNLYTTPYISRYGNAVLLIFSLKVQRHGVEVTSSRAAKFDPQSLISPCDWN